MSRPRMIWWNWFWTKPARHMTFKETRRGRERAQQRRSKEDQ